jgi:hypothetical protein
MTIEDYTKTQYYLDTTKLKQDINILMSNLLNPSQSSGDIESACINIVMCLSHCNQILHSHIYTKFGFCKCQTTSTNPNLHMYPLHNKENRQSLVISNSELRNRMRNQAILLNTQMILQGIPGLSYPSNNNSDYNQSINQSDNIFQFGQIQRQSRQSNSPLSGSESDSNVNINNQPDESDNDSDDEISVSSEQVIEYENDEVQSDHEEINNDDDNDDDNDENNNDDLPNERYISSHINYTYGEQELVERFNNTPLEVLLTLFRQ